MTFSAIIPLHNRAIFLWPKRAYKIVMDGIESHPFHLGIENDWLLIHQATDPKRPSLKSFFPKKGTGKRL
jgi:hypothetical protein